MSRTNPPIQRRHGGQPVARRDRSRHRRGDAYIASSASGPPPPSVQVVHVSSHHGVNGATRGSGQPAASGSRCGPPAVASSPSACPAITSTPPRDRRTR